MVVTNNLGKAAQTVATGVVGVAAYDVVKRLARRVSRRDVAVASLAVGLQAMRNVEKSAEGARLKTADLIAEAKERIGEHAAPPGVSGPGHDHVH